MTEALHAPLPAARRDPELVQIHADAGRSFQACLPGSWVPAYLATRRLDAALLPTSPWKIGYAPATWTVLTDHLRRRGYSDKTLLASGLVVPGRNGHLRDHFHDRLMIPLRAADGIVVAFIGRRHPDAGDERGPKYLNSPDTALFTKSHILAGLYECRAAFKRGAQPILTEGPLDAIAVSIAAPGQFTGVASCGTALTSDQIAALARAIPLQERGMRVALDGDQPGRSAAVRAYSQVANLTSNLTHVVFPEGADPAGILQERGPQALYDTLAESVRPLADLVVDTAMEEWAHGRDLIFAELQIGALRAAGRAIAAMPPDQVGPQASRLCTLFADRYGWHYEHVNREIVAAIEHHYESGACLVLPSWATVLRATAPAVEQAPTQGGTVTPRRRHLRPVPEEGRGRG